MNVPNPPDIHFVLVNTTHSGNIGAAARAMKTMGYTSLRLVQPCHYLTTDALARASGADDIVKAATVYPSLSDALSDCTSVYGTSARHRSLEWSVMPARECAARIHQESAKATAIVFGRERSGLTNDELSLCNHRLWIPCNPEFSSLNLGSAVQVVAYELRVVQQEMIPVAAVTADSGESPVADSGSMEQFYTHLEQTMVDIGFLDRDNPRLLMRRLRRYFGRNRPQGAELNILRGILTAAQKNKR